MAKTSARKQTGNFLDDFERSRAYGILKKADYFAPTSSDPLANERNLKYQSLTGAYPAILPMRISTIGADEKKVSFVLLINTETWNEGRNNGYQSTYTRTGWVPQLWGPNQDTVSSTGKTAAFMNPSVGLDNFTRDMSFGYLNFLSLISAYKNNGYKLGDATKVNEITRVIKMVYGIRVEYDNNILMGHFNNFTLDEDEEHPFIFNYNFEFITSTVNDGSIGVRGHFRKLPDDQDLITGTAASSTELMLVSDPYVKQPNYPTVPPKPTDDRTVIRLWERKTGLLWSDALRLHQTNGSVQGNLILRQKLLSQNWDKGKKAFA